MQDALLFQLNHAVDKYMHAAALLEDAMAGLGTKDELLVARVVRYHWDSHAMANIKGAFHQRYKTTLAKRIKGETSGDYERFIDVDGQKYSHILDPRTGRPIAPAFTSVTIVNSMCVVAGSFSTIALLKSGENKKWLEESGAEYLVVNHDLTLSGNIKNKVCLV